MTVRKIPNEYVVNFDNIYVLPHSDGYAIYYGDMILIFDESEADEVCYRLKLYSPVFDSLTKEGLLNILQHIKQLKEETNK